MAIGRVSSKNVLEAATGGSETELARKGDRYALTFTMPSMSYAESLEFAGIDRAGVTVVMEVQQPGVVVGAPPDPRVKGAGQAGTTLIIDGLGNGYQMKRGWFLSVITGGQRFLYRLAEPAVATAGGEALLTLQEMLRAPHADNDVVEIVTPKIEGYVRDLKETEVGVDHEVVLQFTVRERE
ncbi:MAG: hypothetical protein SWI22_02175 [Pseudomonadota bacterium]|nr:hypothetical protein [Pseudomonadota bacterium]